MALGSPRLGKAPSITLMISEIIENQESSTIATFQIKPAGASRPGTG
jgi:hypothetical protein